MIVRKSHLRKNIRIKTKDGRIINGVQIIHEGPKYSEHIGIIPVIYRKDVIEGVKRDDRFRTIGVYHFSTLVSKDKFPVIPYIKRKDMSKHIRIYCRKKYNIKRSDIHDIYHLTDSWGMKIYILSIKYNPKIGAHRFNWNNRCVMYNRQLGTTSIYDYMLSNGCSFLDELITPDEINSKEIKISLRDVIQGLKLRNSITHGEE